MVTGRSSHTPVGKSGICTPSDGYRALAAAVLFSAVKENSIDFLLSDAAETYFALLDIDPDQQKKGKRQIRYNLFYRERG